MMSLPHFWALKLVITLQSMENQKGLGFNQAYLCSEVEQRSHALHATLNANEAREIRKRA